MAQRRRIEVTGCVDETNRDLHSIFRNAANDLSQFYSLAMNSQKLAFDAGQRRAIEKVYEWLVLKLQEGKLVTSADVLAYMQADLNNTVPSSQLLEATGSGSNQCGASGNTHTELNLSCPATSVQSLEPDGNALNSRDSEMDIS